MDLLLAISLLAIGIERLGMGVLSSSSKSSKISNIILGALTIILSIIAITYPSITISFILVLLSVSLIIIELQESSLPLKIKLKDERKI